MVRRYASLTDSKALLRCLDASTGPDPNFRDFGTRTLDSTYFSKFAQLIGFGAAQAEAADPMSTSSEGTSRKRQRLGNTA